MIALFDESGMRPPLKPPRDRLAAVHSLANQASEHSATVRVIVSLALLGGFFGVLLAMAYPAVALTAVGSAAVVLVSRHFSRMIRFTERLCIPGTDLCVSLASN